MYAVIEVQLLGLKALAVDDEMMACPVMPYMIEDLSC
jgi:hypothetical protein